MLRDSTFNDAARLAQTADAAAEFVMDEQAFRAFYDRTARGIWAYLARVTGDRQIADDLLQETFYRFLRANSDYTSDEHRRNALYRIATNLARDSRRREVIRSVTKLAGDEIERAPGGDHAGSSERTTDVTRAMARLKPRERAILWLAYAEGASHQEIAGRVGVQAASLKLMLFRARRKLAVLLEGGAK
jgi:RNA polymerase sigma-70 factor (ECF subfamily)